MSRYFGSSPLTRGKHDLRDRLTPEDRLIPAHAGKTRRSRRISPSSGAHPRSRGENEVVHEVHPRVQGSSPLTRGKHASAPSCGQAWGLIPAHAGKTRCAPGATVACPAHPRSRGENRERVAVRLDKAGSSPLTRGKPRPRLRIRSRQRLIPAHAGKTMPPRSPRPPARAHPRSRGENSYIPGGDTGVKGSSPLTRGKQGTNRHDHHRPGLIPAHAGKTIARRFSGPCVRAHPRSRGENAQAPDARSIPRGSSPLTRGKLHAGGVGDRRGGLIPAHAGKTRPTRHQRKTAWAHPRSRGENFSHVIRMSPSAGSSPLTRGKPTFIKFLIKADGLIPAHAGKTIG